MRIALFGPPGVGKGTQANLLVERHGVAHVSTGVIIRQAMRKGTPVGLEAKAYVDRGALVPSKVVRRLAEAALEDVRFENFVLDGYPRTVEQAEWLTEFLGKNQRPLCAVISLKVDDDIIIERLSKRRINRATGENYHLDFKPPPQDVDPALIVQRPDDRPEAILNRLEVYRVETQPVEEYYRELGSLCEVDGLGTFKDVFDRIEVALPCLSHHPVVDAGL